MGAGGEVSSSSCLFSTSSAPCCTFIQDVHCTIVTPFRRQVPPSIRFLPHLGKHIV